MSGCCSFEMDDDDEGCQYNKLEDKQNKEKMTWKAKAKKKGFLSKMFG